MAPTAKISHFDEKEKATRGACPRRRGGRGGWSLLAVPGAPARWPVCSEAERPELTTPLHSTRMTDGGHALGQNPQCGGFLAYRGVLAVGQKGGSRQRPASKGPLPFRLARRHATFSLTRE